MAFKIQEFRSNMYGDGARPNLFEVSINLPTSGFANIAGGALNFAEKLRFSCRTAQLPGSTMGQVVQNYFGRELKFAGNRTFPEWTVTVINDEDFLVRNAFEKWMNGLNMHRDNIRHASAYTNLDYTADGEVFQWGKLGDAGGPIKKYKFIGMFPIDVSPIELDWGSNDMIEEYTVTFAYQWWSSEDDGVTT